MTALPRRQLNRIAKERRILEAALRVFSDTGYSGTTMDALAAAAGGSGGLLHGAQRLAAYGRKIVHVSHVPVQTRKKGACGPGSLFAISASRALRAEDVT